MKFKADIFIDRGKARLVDEFFAQKSTGFEETSALWIIIQTATSLTKQMVYIIN